MFFRQRLPPSRDVRTRLGNLLPGLHLLHDLQCLERSAWPNSLRPKRAADESALGGFHDFAASDCRGNRIAVAQRLAEDRHIGLNAVHEMQAPESLTKAGCAFIKNQ